MFSLFEEDLNYVFSKAKTSFDALADAKIFITGGTGFFGRWLLETLCYAKQKLHSKMELVLLSRNPEIFLKKAPALATAPGVSWIKGDVCDFSFPPGNFTHVIHAATEASASLNENDPIQMFSTALLGTKRVLDFVKEKGVQNMLFTSSGAVYGKQPSEITHIPEEFTGAPDILNPASAYAEGKRAAEHLCALYAKQYGLDIKIARCFAFVGPYLPLDTHFAIGNFIQNRLENKSIEVNGDGSPFRSYQYAADLVIWLITILMKGKSMRPYNVGSSEDCDIAQLAETIASITEPKLAVRIKEKRDPQKIPARYVPSTARGEKELGLEKNLSLKEAILRTLAWHYNPH